ncbi:MAG: lysine--tRNA ligase [Clostridia bacterium]|nr:lysine--tRNA ligase [Clostridia bacterium]
MDLKNDLIKIRLEKEDKLKELGVNVRPEKFAITHTIKEAMTLPEETQDVCIAGRVMSKRKMGKISFMDLRDVEGRIQLCLKKDEVGEDLYKLIHETLDVGDFIGVKGEIFKTQTGEQTLRIKEYTFLGKSYRPLPEKFHGVTNQEILYRERHLDLIMNEETKKRFLLRSNFIKYMREFLDSKSFIEVDTPILQNTASGATARPFITHHNTYDTDVFLRISPELTLKKLIIAGFNNIFEIARDFRNEGISVNHLQDFTMIEGYSAYYNYEDNMKLMKDMIVYIIGKLFDGNLDVTIGEQVIHFGGEWGQVSFRDLLIKDCGIDIDEYKTAEELLAKIKECKIELEDENIELLGRGNLIDLLYKKVSRPKIVNPTFLIQHPIDLSPLARANDKESSLTDRFQLIVNGQEIINGYSELVDAREQEKRFMEQSKLKENGDEEAMSIDYEYIKAMEYGMPPISGWGLGIDRFLQFLTNSYNIRDVVLYPLLKPRTNVEVDDDEAEEVQE